MYEMIIFALSWGRSGKFCQKGAYFSNVPQEHSERTARCGLISQRSIPKDDLEDVMTIVASIRLTCAIEVSCPERSKTLVLRFEKIIRVLEELN